MRKEKPIQRYSAPERINHWIVALCFVFAAISGLGFFFLLQLADEHLRTPQLAHSAPVCRGDLFAAFLLMFLRY